MNLMLHQGVDIVMTPFKNVQRILAVKFRLIGDVLLTVPALKAIKASFPDASLTVLLNKGTEDMLTGNPVIDRIICYDRSTNNSKFLGRLKEEWRIFTKVRESRFDMVVNFTEGDRGAFISLLSGARYRLGFDPLGKGFIGKAKFYTHKSGPQDWSVHAVEKDFSLLEPFGIRGGDGEVDLYYSREAERRTVELLKESGTDPDLPFVVIHPASLRKYKSWTVEGNARVVDWLETNGIQTVITCGPDREEREMLGQIEQMCESQPVLFPGTLSLKELSAIIDRAVLLFGVDSAPVHMAAALETPAVVLFGPTRELNWRPYGDGHTLITSERECRPCGEEGCDGSGLSDCLTEIPSSRVIGVLEEKLASLEEL